MEKALLKIPFGMIDRAKTFDNIRSVFTIFITENEILNTPFNVYIEDDKLKAKGVDTEIFYPGDKDQGQFEIWELKNIISSHISQGGNLVVNPKYPEGVQERQYHKDVNEQIKVKRNASDLNPAFLITNNPDCVNGPPVITKSGVVLGGNSRTMSLSLVYEDYPEKAEIYKRFLKDQIETFGLSAGDLTVFKQPVLVRVINKNLSIADMAKMSRNYNTPLTQSMDAYADGISRSKFISDACLNIFKDGIASKDFNTIREFLNSPASKTFVQRLEDDGALESGKTSTYFEKGTRNLTAYGKMIVEAMLRGLIVDEYELLTTVPKSIVAKIDKAIGTLAILKMDKGKFNINEKLKNALRLVREYEKLKENGNVDLNNFLATQEGDILSNMTNGALSHNSELEAYKSDYTTRDLFLMLIKCGQNEITSIFKKYHRAVIENRSFMSGMLDSDIIPETIKNPLRFLHELIDTAIQKGNVKQNNLFESNTENSVDISNILYKIQNVESVKGLNFILQQIFKTNRNINENMYQKLLNGDYNDQKPLVFLKTLTQVYKEIKQNIGKIKQPVKDYIELHLDWIL